MRFDASMESLLNVGRSESFADLNNTALGNKFTPGLKFNTINFDVFALLMVFSLLFAALNGAGAGGSGVIRNRHSFGGKGSTDDSPGKAFGIGVYIIPKKLIVKTNIFYLIYTHH